MRHHFHRAVWLFPNILSYLAIVSVSVWVFNNREDMREIGVFGIYAGFLLLFSAITLFGTFRIWTWIRAGKI
ncbi:hypothetical protein NCCP2716_26040 [Sporosarcina sp. NCCP-2716]|uniref:hypothetical protein n=1 Tax=Sporosarcina sp. NCCP-2716 TaxID=2943679 RepID=UPI0020419D61|nr:hypothetical protein [Sporosarcina sp. NCCP-2716]GKV70106.1 hypothetical protein NCCP2716_26040 [Sporosarcina sp. NCCP-2716]